MYLDDIVSQASTNNIPIEIGYELDIVDGIVFLFAAWSGERKYLKTLVDELETAQLKPNVYVFDIDSEIYQALSGKYSAMSLSQGTGETYLVQGSKIVYKINMHDRENESKEIRNMLSLLTDNL